MKPVASAPSLTVAFKTLGCKVNRVESEQVAATLLGRGVSVVEEDEAAVVVVNTCTVTGEADSKARKAVRHALALPVSPVVVVTGCLASLDADGLRSLGERVVVEADKSQVAEKVSSLLHVDSSTPSHVVRKGAAFNTRAAIKVEDGCNAFCSYCIIPYARGVPTSVPHAQVIAECEELVASAVKEFVLTGINIGRYHDGEVDLPQLIRDIAATGVDRIRLSSIEPLDLTNELIEVFATTPAACPHLHVPLQAGTDAVLKAMNRNYIMSQFEGRIAAAREAIPGLAVTTDIIAGFPTETDTDAQQTLAACERIGFSKLHVFRFSSRKGTPAAQMPQLAPETIAARAAALRDLGDKMRANFLSAKVGEDVEMLVETVSDGRAKGTTRDYASVETHTPNAAPGDILTVCVTSADRGILTAE